MQFYLDKKVKIIAEILIKG